MQQQELRAKAMATIVLAVMKCFMSGRNPRNLTRLGNEKYRESWEIYVNVGPPRIGRAPV